MKYHFCEIPFLWNTIMEKYHFIISHLYEIWKITNAKIYKIIKYNFCAYDSNDTSIQCQLPCRGIQWAQGRPGPRRTVGNVQLRLPLLITINFWKKIETDEFLLFSFRHTCQTCHCNGIMLLCSLADDVLHVSSINCCIAYGIPWTDCQAIVQVLVWSIRISRPYLCYLYIIILIFIWKC